MSVAKITEISAVSSTSFEDAVKVGVARANKTLKNITGAWVSEQKVSVSDGEITGYQVTMRVTFILEAGGRDGAGRGSDPLPAQPRGRPLHHPGRSVVGLLRRRPGRLGPRVE